MIEALTQAVFGVVNILMGFAPIGAFGAMAFTVGRYGLSSLGPLAKLEKLGCSKALVGLIMPTGYTFNTDGSCLYMTIAALFVAQATNTPLTLMQQLILGIDRFMSMFRAAVNVIGNGVATLVISRWERELDAGALREKLASS